MTEATTPRIRLGVSACLLGATVRYDGGHKHDALLATLEPFVEWIGVCPEVECGMGTPREPIQLVDRDGQLRLLGVHTAADHTERMTDYARRRLAELDAAELCGYVLKQGSPSCGINDVAIHGGLEQAGSGMFAAGLMARFPNLPVEDERRLGDPELRDNFIERVFAYRRLRALFQPRWTTGDLVAFHTAHKLVLMAHSPSAYRALGRLVAQARTSARGELQAEYQAQFMRALATVVTPARHANVLQHVLGYFRRTLDAGVRADLVSAIEDYRHGRLALSELTARLRDLARQHDFGYLVGQRYLEPDPYEMLLRTGG